jgi:hypothetical protein
MNTFTIDAYKGYSEAELKRRCRELCRVNMHKDIIIAVLAKHGFDNLNDADKEEVKRICSQWDD